MAPLLVLGFLAMVALYGPAAVHRARTVETAQELVLAAALFGLGRAVHLPSPTRTGGRVAALGLCAWVMVARRLRRRTAHDAALHDLAVVGAVVWGPAHRPRALSLRPPHDA